jgi:hypothetical protein
VTSSQETKMQETKHSKEPEKLVGIHPRLLSEQTVSFTKDFRPVNEKVHIYRLQEAFVSLNRALLKQCSTPEGMKKLFETMEEITDINENLYSDIDMEDAKLLHQARVKALDYFYTLFQYVTYTTREHYEQWISKTVKSIETIAQDNTEQVLVFVFEDKRSEYFHALKVIDQLQVNPERVRLSNVSIKNDLGILPTGVPIQLICVDDRCMLGYQRVSLFQRLQEISANTTNSFAQFSQYFNLALVEGVELIEEKFSFFFSSKTKSNLQIENLISPAKVDPLMLPEHSNMLQVVSLLPYSEDDGTYWKIRDLSFGLKELGHPIVPISRQVAYYEQETNNHPNKSGTFLAHELVELENRVKEKLGI